MRFSLKPEQEVKDSLDSRKAKVVPLSSPFLKVVRADDTIAESVHGLPEEWLRSRVRGWMQEENKVVDQAGVVQGIADWWIGCYAGKRWIFAATDDDRWSPGIMKEDFARRVCRYINRECANGGAWLTGWSRCGAWFYLLWKDSDGDLQIEVAFNTGQANLAFDRLLGWSMEDFCEHCEQAYKTHRDWHRDMDYAKGQQVKLAQGEKETRRSVLNVQADARNSGTYGRRST